MNRDDHRPLEAIETHYKGYRFRSRLEARWAVFFDALGVEYDYEAEGYQLGNGLFYLPDFWVPSLDAWIEIKAKDPAVDSIEWQKASVLARTSGKRVYLFYGPISPPQGDWNSEENASAWAFMPMGDPDLYEEQLDNWWFAYWWSVCPECDIPGIAFSGNARGLRCGHGVDQEMFDAPRLLNAYTRARSARFEFGEHG